MAIKVNINGLGGKMGKEISCLIEKNEDYLLIQNKYDEFDIILDFSSPEGNRILLEFLESKNIVEKSILIGTTGIEKDQLALWEKISLENSLNVLVAPNTSLGILMAVRAAMQLVGVLEQEDFDVEIVETHHRHKLDAPSGTALFLANNVAKASKNLQVCTSRSAIREKHQLGVHAVRGGGVFGEHEIRFISSSEEISISHRAFSRELFGKGALVLGKWLNKQNPGFYNLFDIKLEDMI